MASAFPLQWPDGWARTPLSQRRRAPYKLTPDRATSELIHSLKLLGVVGGSIIVSTNIPVRKDGLPYATFREPDDQGVAVYWNTRAHGERVMACDKWLRVHENIRAIGLAVEGLRAIDRAGASQILERAYSAFGALPPAADVTPVRPWWEVLGLPHEAVKLLDLTMCEARYRESARKAHPDAGGSDAAMAELNRAREEMRRHFGGGS
jgi:hypothetical protein